MEEGEEERFLDQIVEMWLPLRKILLRMEVVLTPWGQIRIRRGLFFLSKYLTGEVKMQWSPGLGK